jgi:hypothetical protein
VAVGGGGQPSGLAGLGDEFIQSGFDHGRQAGGEPFDFVGDEVHADHVMAVLGQRGGADATDVSESEYAYFHNLIFS